MSFMYKNKPTQIMNHFRKCFIATLPLPYELFKGETNMNSTHGYLIFCSINLAKPRDRCTTPEGHNICKSETNEQQTA